MSTIRIAHLSDPHFGTVLAPVKSALLGCLIELKPDLCLISGDITQRARRSQFLEARAFANDLLPLPSFAIPGNHDIPLFNLFGRFMNPYHGFRTYLQTANETSITLGAVSVVGLNSTSRWRHVQGKLNIERVRPALIAKKSSSVKIVAIHHPLDCAKRIDDKNLLVNREEVLDFFESAEVDLVLSGHVHDPFVTLSKERHAASRRSMILSTAGTCLSWRTREDAPNSFSLVEIDTGGEPQIKISRFDMDPNHVFSPRNDSVASFVRRSNGNWERC